MFNMGPTEILVIFLIIIILFGAKRLPELARSLGKSIREFKSATQGIKDEFDINKIEDKSSRPVAGSPPAGAGSPPKSTEEAGDKPEPAQKNG